MIDSLDERLIALLEKVVQYQAVYILDKVFLNNENRGMKSTIFLVSGLWFDKANEQWIEY